MGIVARPWDRGIHEQGGREGRYCGQTCTRYWKSLRAGPPPRTGTVWKPPGAPDSSSAVARAGRMAAWGHTNAQMLHCRGAAQGATWCLRCLVGAGRRWDGQGGDVAGVCSCSTHVVCEQRSLATPPRLCVSTVHLAGCMRRQLGWRRAPPRTGEHGLQSEAKREGPACVQLAEFQAGILLAMERFSITVVPGGKKPPGANTLQGEGMGRRRAVRTWATSGRGLRRLLVGLPAGLYL